VPQDGWVPVAGFFESVGENREIAEAVPLERGLSFA
jgi:hypothetical protein